MLCLEWPPQGWRGWGWDRFKLRPLRVRTRWTLRARRKSVKSVYGGGLSRAAFWGGLDAFACSHVHVRRHVRACRGGGGAQDKSENKGLISEDRSNKTTLPLTIPRSLFKSSAKDLAPTMFLVRLTGKLEARSAFRRTRRVVTQEVRKRTSTLVRQKPPE